LNRSLRAAKRFHEGGLEFDNRMSPTCCIKAWCHLLSLSLSLSRPRQNHGKDDRCFGTYDPNKHLPSLIRPKSIIFASHQPIASLFPNLFSSPAAAAARLFLSKCIHINRPKATYQHHPFPTTVLKNIKIYSTAPLYSSVVHPCFLYPHSFCLWAS